MFGHSLPEDALLHIGLWPVGRRVTAYWAMDAENAEERGKHTAHLLACRLFCSSFSRQDAKNAKVAFLIRPLEFSILFFVYGEDASALKKRERAKHQEEQNNRIGMHRLPAETRF